MLKLAEFLTYIVEDLWTIHGFRRATERAKNIVIKHDCIDIVFDKIEKWAHSDLYGEKELRAHARLWDLLTRDKSGKEKEHRFTDW